MTSVVRPFLSVNFTPLPRAEACAVVAAQAARLAPFTYVTTPNVAHIVALHDDLTARRPLYDAAWLRLNDSRILEVLAGISGVELPVAAGSDLTADLFETAIRPTTPITVIGADAALIEALKRSFGLQVVHWHAPPMGLARKPEAVAEAAAFIAAHKAPFVFLCVGAPQQEMVAKAVRDRGDAVGVGLCVGASLEFLVGRIQRAPRWMQTSRLEWLYRLLAEPERLARRYLIEGPKILAIWGRWRQDAA